LSQVETSLSRSIKTIFSRGKDRGSPPDLYIRQINLEPGGPYRLKSCSFHARIVPCDHQKSRVGIVSSSQLRHLTLLAS
jgi:hypothetical protein